MVKLRHPECHHTKEKFKGFNAKDVNIPEISKDYCRNWAAECAKGNRPTIFNHAMGTLRESIGIGIEQGARFDNPASCIERLPEKPKALKLAEPKLYLGCVDVIDISGGGWAKPCGWE